MGLARLPSGHRLAQLGARFGTTAALWLVLDMPVGFRPARIPTPATGARIETPTWPAPKTPIPGLLTTTDLMSGFYDFEHGQNGEAPNAIDLSRSWPFGGYRNKHTFSCKRGFLPIAGREPAMLYKISFAVLTTC